MDFLLTSIISLDIFRPDYSVEQIVSYFPAPLTRRWRRKLCLSQYYSRRMTFRREEIIIPVSFNWEATVKAMRLRNCKLD